MSCDKTQNEHDVKSYSDLFKAIPPRDTRISDTIKKRSVLTSMPDHCCTSVLNDPQYARCAKYLPPFNTEMNPFSFQSCFCECSQPLKFEQASPSKSVNFNDVTPKTVKDSPIRKEHIKDFCAKGIHPHQGTNSLVYTAKTDYVLPKCASIHVGGATKSKLRSILKPSAKAAIDRVKYELNLIRQNKQLKGKSKVNDKKRTPLEASYLKQASTELQKIKDRLEIINRLYKKDAETFRESRRKDIGSSHKLQSQVSFHSQDRLHGQICFHNQTVFPSQVNMQSETNYPNQSALPGQIGFHNQTDSSQVGFESQVGLSQLGFQNQAGLYKQAGQVGFSQAGLSQPLKGRREEDMVSQIALQRGSGFHSQGGLQSQIGFHNEAGPSGVCFKSQSGLHKQTVLHTQVDLGQAGFSQVGFNQALRIPRREDITGSQIGLPSQADFQSQGGIHAQIGFHNQAALSSKVSFQSQAGTTNQGGLYRQIGVSKDAFSQVGFGQAGVGQSSLSNQHGLRSQAALHNQSVYNQTNLQLIKQASYNQTSSYNPIICQSSHYCQSNLTKQINNTLLQTKSTSRNQATSCNIENLIHQSTQKSIYQSNFLNQPNLPNIQECSEGSSRETRPAPRCKRTSGVETVATMFNFEVAVTPKSKTFNTNTVQSSQSFVNGPVKTQPECRDSYATCLTEFHISASNNDTRITDDSSKKLPRKDICCQIHYNPNSSTCIAEVVPVRYQNELLNDKENIRTNNFHKQMDGTPEMFTKKDKIDVLTSPINIVFNDKPVKEIKTDRPIELPTKTFKVAEIKKVDPIIDKFKTEQPTKVKQQNPDIVRIYPLNLDYVQLDSKASLLALHFPEKESIRNRNRNSILLKSKKFVTSDPPQNLLQQKLPMVSHIKIVKTFESRIPKPCKAKEINKDKLGAKPKASVTTYSAFVDGLRKYEYASPYEQKRVAKFVSHKIEAENKFVLNYARKNTDTNRGRKFGAKLRARRSVIKAPRTPPKTPPRSAKTAASVKTPTSKPTTPNSAKKVPSVRKVSSFKKLPKEQSSEKDVPKRRLKTDATQTHTLKLYTEEEVQQMLLKEKMRQSNNLDVKQLKDIFFRLNKQKENFLEDIRNIPVQKRLRELMTTYSGYLQIKPHPDKSTSFSSRSTTSKMSLLTDRSTITLSSRHSLPNIKSSSSSNITITRIISTPRESHSKSVESMANRHKTSNFISHRINKPRHPMPVTDKAISSISREEIGVGTKQEGIMDIYRKYLKTSLRSHCLKKSMESNISLAKKVVLTEPKKISERPRSKSAKRVASFDNLLVDFEISPELQSRIKKLISMTKLSRDKLPSLTPTTEKSDFSHISMEEFEELFSPPTGKARIHQNKLKKNLTKSLSDLLDIRADIDHVLAGCKQDKNKFTERGTSPKLSGQKIFESSYDIVRTDESTLYQKQSATVDPNNIFYVDCSMAEKFIPLKETPQKVNVEHLNEKELLNWKSKSSPAKRKATKERKKRTKKAVAQQVDSKNSIREPTVIIEKKKQSSTQSGGCRNRLTYRTPIRKSSFLHRSYELSKTDEDIGRFIWRQKQKMSKFANTMLDVCLQNENGTADIDVKKLENFLGFIDRTPLSTTFEEPQREAMEEMHKTDDVPSVRRFPSSLTVREHGTAYENLRFMVKRRIDTSTDRFYSVTEGSIRK